MNGFDERTLEMALRTDFECFIQKVYGSLNPASPLIVSLCVV
ncbi:MAG: hypothetical protein Q8M26_11455 [Pseudolabrys sp.]|nr:hypothetical protein [Pseudolabrys sp.]